MRPSPLPAMALAALLVLAGCAGLPGAGDSAPSPEAFPDASAIDQSVYERHAALLANTSFTATFETTRKTPDPRPGYAGNFTWLNSSQRVLVDPGASQYLAHPNGTLNYLGTTRIQSVYSNGTRSYALQGEGNESIVEAGDAHFEFNESGDHYLWRGWAERPWYSLFHFVSSDATANVTFERKGIETFDGVDVMRYEASGVDALPDVFQEDEYYTYTDFSVTLLLDADGVIRYYQAELDRRSDDEDIPRERQLSNRTLVATVTDVGSTDVETPDWVSNATARS